jgi:hypothetical protein
MGFGIDSKSARLWKFPILYTLDDKFSGQQQAAIVKAMKSWGEPFFRPVPEIPDSSAQAPIKVVCIQSGTTQWRAGDGLNGKPPSGGGTVNIKFDSSYDTIVHELGHVLGLSHEQDRPDGADYRKTLTVAGEITEIVAANAQKKYVAYGKFDPDSIMCYGTKNTDGPSVGDLTTIAAIYGLQDN